MVRCIDFTEGDTVQIPVQLCLPCLPLAEALVPPAFFSLTLLAVDGFFRPPNLTWKNKIEDPR